MNNENELHDVTFKIRYPSKKEKILYAVKSIFRRKITEDVTHYRSIFQKNIFLEKG